jgi:hypothetical protein
MESQRIEICAVAWWKGQVLSFIQFNWLWCEMARMQAGTTVFNSVEEAFQVCSTALV